MKAKIIELRKQILPILLFCQANKGDLTLWEDWKNREDAVKKYFYTYYSGLFCRIQYQLENDNRISIDYIENCEELLRKYRWFKIDEQSIKLFASGNPRDCEVPEAQRFITGIDDVLWGMRQMDNMTDAICLRMNSGYWSFADVKGTAISALQKKEN